MFYMYRPSQVRNQAMGLMEDHEPSTAIREIWERAHEEWVEYGNKKISNTLGITVTLEDLVKYEADIEAFRDKLDEFKPADGEEGSTLGDIRKEMISDMLSEARIPEDEVALLDIPSDELNDEDRQRVTNIRKRIDQMDRNLDQKLALETSDEDRLEAKKIADEVMKLRAKIRTIIKDSGTVNYNYWRGRNESEALEETNDAHLALYDARQMWRKSIYDDEYEFNYKTKERTITKQGAISLYLDAFAKWKEVYDRHPILEEGVFTDNLISHFQDFNKMLTITNREWPENFPFQELIDRRAEGGNSDGLPTTDDLEELRSGRSDDNEYEDEDSEEMESDESEGSAESKKPEGEGTAEEMKPEETKAGETEMKKPEEEKVEIETKPEAETKTEVETAKPEAETEPEKVEVGK